MLRLASLVVLVLLLTVQSTTARAEESRESADSVATEQPAPPTRWSGRALSFTGFTGFTPAGAFGGAFELTPIDALSIEGGFGAAWGGGGRGMLMPRGRVFLGRSVAVSLGAGISAGNHTDPGIPACIFGCSAHKDWKQAVFADALAGIEGRNGSGFVWRAFVGAGWLANPSDYRCVGYGACESSSRFTPYVGASLGYAARMSR